MRQATDDTELHAASPTKSNLASSGRLRDAVLRSLRLPAQPRTSSDRLDVGVEHEFFLLDRSGQPATHEASQRYFLTLAATNDWVVHARGEDVLGPMILSLMRVRTPGVGAILKYDHHPHLLEVAMAPRKQVEILREDLKATLKQLDLIAESCRVHASRGPILALPCDDPRIVSPLRAFVQLRRYRSMLYERRGETSTANVNYAACIAATQTHVGLDWWKMPDLVDRLYAREATNGAFAYRRFDDAERIRSQRWSGFDEVFRGSPLAGRPTFAPWSIDRWCEALLDTPLAGLERSDWSARTPRELGSIEDEDLPKLLIEIRDLQLIRPRSYATLEFRGDPAQPNADDVADLVAHRLRCVISELSDD